MKKCNKCKVDVLTDQRRCPLCFEFLEDTGEEVREINYPKHCFEEPKYNIFLRIITYITIIGILGSVLVNILTYDKNSYLWSVLVFLGLIYIWILLRSTFKARTNAAPKLVIQMMALSIITFAVDFLNEYDKWSINYIIPFISMASLLSIIALFIGNGVRFGEYAFYLFAASFLGLVPFILWLFSLVDVLWPSLAAASLSVATIIGMIVFIDKDTKEEIKKRFHI